MKFFFISICLFLQCLSYDQNDNLLIEAESFEDKGGWLVDPQFVEQMGSPYLLAHGIGKPVKDARTSFQVNGTSNYHFWVRTKNWAIGDWIAPGRFTLKIDDYSFPENLGTQAGWSWQYAGRRTLKKGQHEISLVDLTGFDGRCDAIYISSNDTHPPSEKVALNALRSELQKIPDTPEKKENFDLIIVGGGLAGTGAAIAAAEEGLQVALIHDRPVLGGNASGEIRVHTLGIYGHYERILKMIDTEHYPNGSPKAYGEDERRMANVGRYKNIHLFLNWRAFDAHADNNIIQYIDAKHTSTGELMRFEAPLFVDSTGDGWIGFWTGASFMYGRESVDTFGEAWEKHGELWSPEKADNFVMGSSVLWRSEKLKSASNFPTVPWAMEVANEHAAANGEWQWEFSRNDLNQIEDAEQIRDHMLKAIYGSFFNEKQKPQTDSLSLKWVSYLVGKRESRRLIGDHIYTFLDAKHSVKFPDSVVVEEREIDVHFQQNLLDPNKPDFLSAALFYRTDRYYVPYRSLYSKNIKNLFMAGRCFSCSHVGLGGPRVMRTTGQMGASVGYAGSLCKKHNVYPRAIYENHLKEYMKLVLSSDGKK